MKIGWGRDSREPEDADDSDVTTHEFGSEAELKAFLEGVSASSGWTEYALYDYSADFVAGHVP